MITSGDTQAAKQMVKSFGYLHIDIADYEEMIAQLFTTSREKACEECLQAKAMLALESLTPGGSEFVGDVKRCVDVFRARRQHDFDFIKKKVKECRELEAKVKVARELLWVLQTEPSQQNKNNSTDWRKRKAQVLKQAKEAGI